MGVYARLCVRVRARVRVRVRARMRVCGWAFLCVFCVCIVSHLIRPPFSPSQLI